MECIHFCSKCLFGFAVLVLVLLYIPGIPPHVTFSSFHVDPSQPREGPLAPNTILDNAERMYEGHFFGPESIASRANNEIFVGLHNGNIMRVYGQDFEKSQVVTNLGPGCAGPWEEHICGRPLGLRFTKEKKLLIADCYLGLFEFDLATGEKELLVDPNIPIEGAKPLLIDDMDIDDDGFIYWSDASSNSYLHNGVVALLSDPAGRLIKYNPQTKKCDVLLSNLHFANGVQLSKDQKFVLVAETYRHRVVRYWLKGPKAGTSEIFVSGLPGMPDNIRARKDRGYYLSLVATRNPDEYDLYALITTMPRFRKVSLRATALLQKFMDLLNYYYPHWFFANFSYKIFNLGVMSKWTDNGETIIVEVDEEGKIIGSLQGRKGVLTGVSQTQQVGNYIFFGSPWAPFLGRIHIDQIKQEPQIHTSTPTEGKTHETKEEL